MHLVGFFYRINPAKAERRGILFCEMCGEPIVRDPVQVHRNRLRLPSCMETIPSLLARSRNEDCAGMTLKRLSSISQASLLSSLICYSRL